MTPPPVRDFGAPHNGDEQKAAARVLLQLAREGLEAHPDFRASDPRQQELDVAAAALRRVIGAALADFPHGKPEVLGVALASGLGAHVGHLLFGLPDTVIQAALTAHTVNILDAIGADPSRSAADISISSGLETTH